MLNLFSKNMSCIILRKQAVIESVIQIILSVGGQGVGVVFGFVWLVLFFLFFLNEASCHHKEKQIPIFPVTYPNRFRHLSHPSGQMILPITEEHAQTETEVLNY